MNLNVQARRIVAAAALVGSLASGGIVSASSLGRPPSDTTTPVKHVVVIFQENVSFDHYFGTYPNATNPSGDLTDFWKAADAGNMPAVTFLKAKAFQDGHAGYSNPLDEQTFLVDTLNHLQRLPTWRDTAVVIAYDDSDGWYDHAMPPIVNHSNDPAYDAVAGPGNCGVAKPGAYLDRCGDGPRQPLLLISPFARANFVDHSITSQASILRFIEDNWSLGRIGDQSFDAIAGPLNNLFDFGRGRDDSGSRLILNPSTGEPARFRPER